MNGCRHRRFVLYQRGFAHEGECQECGAKVRDVVTRVDAAERALDHAEATIAAMREAVLEFELRPPEGEFRSYKDGQVYATAPDRVRGYFEALDARWKSPEVARWSEEFRTARDRADLYRSQRDLAVQALRKAHDAMMTWFSSEYADHPTAREVSRVLEQLQREVP